MSIELERFHVQPRPGRHLATDVDTSGMTSPAPQSRRSSDTAESLHAERAIEALPPCDTGPQAWKFLLGCFMLEAAFWGRQTFLVFDSPSLTSGL